jgi:hypothetical protein
MKRRIRVIVINNGGSRRDKILLNKGPLFALQMRGLADEGKYPGMKISFPSLADRPFAEKGGRATLKLLEAIPSCMTVWDLVIRNWDN